MEEVEEEVFEAEGAEEEEEIVEDVEVAGNAEGGEDEMIEGEGGEDEIEEVGEEGEAEIEEDVEEEEGPKTTKLSDLMGEAMRQQVQRKARSVPNSKLSIYSTVQLSTEIEAIKKQERALMTKVEH